MEDLGASKFLVVKGWLYGLVVWLRARSSITTVDDINPAVPIMRIYDDSHTLGSLRSCRIYIINSRAPLREPLKGSLRGEKEPLLSLQQPGAITNRRPGSRGTCGPSARCGCRASRGGGRCGGTGRPEPGNHVYSSPGRLSAPGLEGAAGGPTAEGPCPRSRTVLGTARHRCGSADRAGPANRCRAGASLRPGTMDRKPLGAV